MKGNSIGIVSIATYLPDREENSLEIAIKSGLSQEIIEKEFCLKKKRIPGEVDHPICMAIAAGKLAVERASLISPNQVDLVIWVGEEYREYIAQTASIKLQYELGIEKGWAFDMSLRGVTFIAGLKLAKDILQSDPHMTTILLAGGTRNIDLLNYKKERTHLLLPLSAGGAAVIIQRGHPINVLMQSAFTSDYEMVDTIYVPGGGTVHPFSHENLNSELMSFEVLHPERLESYMEENYPHRIVEVIRRSIEKSGLNTKDLSYLALRHLRSSHRNHVLKELGLTEEKSISLGDVGHIGPVDPILSLELALEQKKIQKGDIIVLASAGIGFVYGAITIQWGELY